MMGLGEIVIEILHPEETLVDRPGYPDPYYTAMI